MKKILITIATIIICGLFITDNSQAYQKSLNIVLLGDSYSAGNGAGHYSGVDGCYRSQDNWAQKFIQHLNNQDIKTTFQNRACSGAKIEDFTKERILKSYQKTYYMKGKVNQQKALSEIKKQKLCQEMTIDDVNGVDYEINKITYQMTSGRQGSRHERSKIIYNCLKKLKPQLDFIGPQIDLVLMTIGGNDVGFGDIVRYCFGVEKAQCQKSIIEAKEYIKNDIKDDIKSILSQMRAKGLRKDAKVILLGYPHLALEMSDRYIWRKEIQQIRELNDLGTAAQAKAIAEDNLQHPGQIIYLDSVANKFKGHEPNPSLLIRNPNRWIHELFEPSFDIAEWYHPNQKGQKAYSEILKEWSINNIKPKPITDKSQNIDIVFNIDTTGSMETEINNIKQEIKTMVMDIKAKSKSARFAVVTYRDFADRTGDREDYPSRLEIDFTDDKDAIFNAVSKIDLGYGGDFPETAYSGIMSGLKLNWRAGVHKIVLTLTDSIPLDPEPKTNYTAATVIQAAFNVDPAQLYFVNTGSSTNNKYYQLISDKTGGKTYTTQSSMVASVFLDSVNDALEKPHAWINGPYIVKTGESLKINADGSYSPNGELVKFEWDFNNDKIIDLVTTESIITHKFTEDYSGLMSVTITDDKGQKNIATTPFMVSNDGDMIEPKYDNCPNVFNPSQIDSDGDGIGDDCDKTHGNPFVEAYEKAQRDYQKKIAEEIKQEQTKPNIEPKQSESTQTPQSPQSVQSDKTPIITPTKPEKTIQTINNKLIQDQKPTIIKDNNNNVSDVEKIEKKIINHDSNQHKRTLKDVLYDIGESNLYIILICFATAVSYLAVKIIK